MTFIEAETEYLYSSLADDPDLAEIIEMFVEEMPERTGHLYRALEEANWEALSRLAHQMKGACGSYGFHQLTPSAARVETAVRSGEEEGAIRQAVEALATLCQRVRAGSPLEKVAAADH